MQGFHEPAIFVLGLSQHIPEMRLENRQSVASRRVITLVLHVSQICVGKPDIRLLDIFLGAVFLANSKVHNGNLSFFPTDSDVFSGNSCLHIAVSVSDFVMTQPAWSSRTQDAKVQRSPLPYSGQLGTLSLWFFACGG